MLYEALKWANKEQKAEDIVYMRGMESTLQVEKSKQYAVRLKCK